MPIVKIYGTPSTKYDYLLDKISKVIQDENLDFTIKKVQDVAIFLEDGVESIPTIRFNNHLELSCDKDMNFDEFVELAIQKISNHNSDTDPKRILVPTDFSENSTNGLNYALELADQFDTEIDIVHIFHPEVITLDGSQVILSYSRDEALEKLNHISNNSKLIIENDQSSINTSLIDGFASEKIIHISEDYDLIILSNSGEGNNINNWFGRTSLEISTKAKCPVLFIPSNNGFKKPISICYAVGKKINYFHKIAWMAEMMAIEVTFLHIFHDKDKKTQNDYKFEEIASLKKKFPSISFKQKTFRAASVEEGLNQIVSEDSPNLLIMEKSNKGFFDRLWHHSATKKAMSTTSIPLLILHEQDKICKCGGICKKKPEDRCDH